MFIPPNKIKPPFEEGPQSEAKISLKASHLVIAKEVAEAIFKGSSNAFVVYYPNRNTLMLAPVSDLVFKQLHKAGQHMLKDRNLKGDKTLALHEILIDHQLDEQDRDLDFEVQSALGILNIKL